MKKIIFNNIVFTVFLSTFVSICSSFAQISIVETPPHALTVCLNPETFSVTFTSATNLTNVQVMLDLAEDVSYVDNSILGASEVSDLPNAPVFGIASMTAGQPVTISYQVKVDCSILPLTTSNINQNSYAFTFNESPFVQNALLQNSYNIKYPDLSINVGFQSTPSGFSIGEIFNFGYYTHRKIELTNDSNGATDTVVIRIIPEPEIHYNDFLAGFSLTSIPPANINYIPNQANPTEIVITLFGATLSNSCSNSGLNDNLFESGEFILINEDFTVVSCESGQTEYRLQWGCNGILCDDGSSGNSFTPSSITVNEGNPQITITSGLKPDLLNYCGKDGEMVFYFHNNGTTPADYAKDFKVDIQSYESIGSYVLPFSFELFDYTTNGGELINSSLITPINSIITFPPASGSAPGYHIDFSGNMNTNILEDLDGDGISDDLGAGQTLELRIKIRYLTTPEFDNECPVEFTHNYGNPQIEFKNACGTVTQTSGANYNSNRYVAYNYYSEQNVDKIAEPADFVEGTPEYFTFCTGNWSFDMSPLDCPVNEFQAVISLPIGYHLSGVDNTATWRSFYGDTLDILAIEQGNQVFISGGGTSTSDVNHWTGCYTVQLELICPENGGVISPSIISWELQYKCDTCDVLQKRACASEEVFNHVTSCPDSISCRGILSTDFDATRTTLGWLDETRTTHVDPNNPNINLNAAYPFDEVQTTTSGEVIETGFNNAFVELKYTSTDTLFSWINGTFLIYDGNTPVGNCTATAPTLTISGNEYVYLFEMPCYGSLNLGDSVVLQANWLVMNSNLINPNAGSPVDIYPIPVFRSKFLVDYNDTLNFCDSWGEIFTLYSADTYPIVSITEGTDGCNEIRVEVYWRNLGGTYYNDFPNEFRDICQLNDLVTFTIPNGYDYIDNSATTYGYQTYEQDYMGSYLPNFLDALIPIESPNTLTFNYPWKLLDKYGKDNFQSANYPIFDFKLRPTCEHDDTIFTIMDYSFVHYHYTENPIYHQTVDWTESNVFVNSGDTTNLTWLHYLPNLTLTPLQPTVDGNENIAQWIVRLCNKVDPQHLIVGNAEGIWLDIDDLVTDGGNILITSVTNSSNTTIYNAGNSAFVEINSLNAGQCIDLNVNAMFTNCVEGGVDSLEIVTGWNCLDYPLPELAESASCQEDTAFLFLNYKTANLQLDADTIPMQAVDICETLHYVYTLTSSSVANMYDVNFWLDLPDGMTVQNAEYLYDETNTIWQTLGAASNNGYNGNFNPLGWDLMTLPGFANGFLGNRFPNQNEIVIRFDLAMDCNFNPADGLNVHADGITNCNDTIPLNSFSLIRISGFEDLVDYNLSHTSVDTLDCEGQNTVSFTVSNESLQANTLGDSLRIDLPSGFSFVPDTGSPTEPTVNGSQVIFAVGTITAGDSTTFTFRIESTSVFDCTTISFPAEIFNTQASNCVGFCDSITASWGDTLNTIYCCNPCDANANFLTDTICVGSEYCFTITDTAMFDDNFNHLWILDEDIYSDADEPCFTFGEVGTFPITHIVYDFENHCADTVTLNMVVTPYPDGSIELLGCNPFCEGDTVYLTVNGVYDSIQWVNIVNGDTLVVGSVDTLAVTSGGEYNAVLYNLPCIGHCLSITLNPQPTPNISLNDTIVCDSLGFVELNAGTGYNHYLWSTGDTTRTIIVGVGTYTVEVGQQLTFGCCLCLATDTVVVSVNNLDVSLIDTTLCNGDSFTLSPNVTGGVPPYTYAWNTGDSTSTIVVDSSGVYSVTVTDAIGCKDSASMTVNLGAEVDASFNSLDTICLNETACFEALNTGSDSWNIYFGNSTPISFGNIDTMCYQFTANGTYTIEHVLIGACGTDTVTHTINVVSPTIDLSDRIVCDSTGTVTLDAGIGYDSYLWSTGDSTQTIIVGVGTYTVTVGNLLNGSLCTATDSITVSISDLSVDITDDTTVCAGVVFVLHSTVSGGVPNYTYLWNTNDVTNYVNTYTAGTYTLTVTDSMGCTATDSMTLNMIYPVDPSFVYDDTICVSDTACFVAQGLNGVDSWNIYSNINGNLLASFGDTSEICFQFSNAGTYTIVHTISNDCFTAIDSNIITVVPPIEACIVMIGSNPFCEGDEVCLTINDPFNQVLQIDWYRDSVFVGSMDTLCVTQGGTYYAIVHDSHGCTNSCMCVVLTTTPVNNDLGIPDTAYVCGGTDTETITASAGFTSYTWYKNGAVVGNNQSLTVSTAGTYILEAQNANGCIGRDTTIVILRQISGIITQTPTTLCVGEAATMTVECDPNYTYVWQRRLGLSNNFVTLGGNGCVNSITVNNVGVNQYRVIITDQLTGCTRTINFTIVAIAGPCNGIIVFPNPTVSGRTTVYYSLENRGITTLELEVNDMYGKKVKTFKLNPDEQEYEIDLSEFKDGIYFVKMIADGEILSNERVILVE